MITKIGEAYQKQALEKTAVFGSLLARGAKAVFSGVKNKLPSMFKGVGNSIKQAPGRSTINLNKGIGLKNPQYPSFTSPKAPKVSSPTPIKNTPSPYPTNFNSVMKTYTGPLKDIKNSGKWSKFNTALNTYSAGDSAYSGMKAVRPEIKPMTPATTVNTGIQYPGMYY